MEQPFVTIAIAIVSGIVASALFSWIQSRQRGVPASEQRLVEYINQLKEELLELRAANRVLEKDRDDLKEERQKMRIEIAKLELRVEDFQREIQWRISGGSGRFDINLSNIGAGAKADQVGTGTDIKQDKS